jgi:hypothetical protein
MNISLYETRHIFKHLRAEQSLVLSFVIKDERIFKSFIVDTKVELQATTKPCIVDHYKVIPEEKPHYFATLAVTQFENHYNS